jgi:hypothetical protein
MNVREWRLPALVGLALVTAAQAAPRVAVPVSAPPSASLNSPNCVRAPEARGEQPGDEELAVGRNGEFCAYPVRMMAYHRVVNDHLGGPPILVSYDPDAGAGRVFDPVLEGKEHTFDAAPAVKGLPALIDRESGSTWSAITGEALSGPLAGRKLKPIPAMIITWDRWKTLHADSWVLAEDPKQSSHYVTRVTPATCPVPSAITRELPMRPHSRVVPDALVLGIDAGTVPLAVPLTGKGGRYAAHAVGLPLSPGEARLILFSDPAAHAAAAYVAEAQSQHLTFVTKESGAAPAWMDDQTGSTWNLEGRCVDGPLKGTALPPANFVRTRWYAWSALFPKSQLVTPGKN